MIPLGFCADCLTRVLIFEVRFTILRVRQRPRRCLGDSDFTVTDSLGVTIAGEPFPHRLYYFRLACSG